MYAVMWYGRVHREKVVWFQNPNATMESLKSARSLSTGLRVCVCAHSLLVFGLLIKLWTNGLVISPRPVPASIKCHSSALLLHNDIYSEL